MYGDEMYRSYDEATKGMDKDDERYDEMYEPEIINYKENIGWCYEYKNELFIVRWVYCDSNTTHIEIHIKRE
jgi:hypothetical protein